MRNTSSLSRAAHSLVAIAALCGAMVSTAALADDPDPPGRVARVNLLDGRGALEPAGSDEWVDDLINRPLTGGDKIWLEAGARAEMHIGSSAVRLGARTALQIVNVDDRSVRLRVTAGSINIRIRSLEDDRFEIETPAGDVELVQAGGYRLDVDDQNARAQLTVWSGRAEAHGAAGSQTVHGNESVEMDSGGQPDLALAGAGSPDSLDLWAEDRDHREDESRAAQYVSRDMVGYEDLDNYGNWADDPQYGSVWYPQVVVDWAPYRYGHWVWLNVWGWTWIDDQPWGFAPCHYGRWIHGARGWGWSPGPRNYHRPVFAPALVAWRDGRYPRGGYGGNPGGAGPGANHGGAPLVGWVPLGYNEIYQPPFHASHNYLRVANLSNTRLGHADVDRYIDARARGGNQPPAYTYVNERVPGAYTAVSRDTFTSARPVARNRVTSPTAAQNDARLEPFSQRGPDVHPDSHSVGRAVASDRPNVRPDRKVFDRPVMKTAPAANTLGTHAPARAPERANMQQHVNTPERTNLPQPKVVERPTPERAQPAQIDRPVAPTVERRVEPTRTATQPQPENRVPQPQTEYHAPQPQPQSHPQIEYHPPAREARSEPAPAPAP
ncbi:MAG: DUF6600 domain-containing protein, partial [Steroidobacteraceae bacterium]